jgi:hypothetical protein
MTIFSLRRKADPAVGYVPDRSFPATRPNFVSSVTENTQAFLPKFTYNFSRFISWM